MLTRRAKRLKTSRNLHEVILSGDVSRVERLLEEGVDPNERGYTFPSLRPKKSPHIPSLPDIPCLHLTVLLNNKPMFDDLLKANCDVDAVSGHPYLLTALDVALLLNRKEMAGKLLDESLMNVSLSELPPKNKRFSRESAARGLNDLLENWSSFNGGENYLHYYCDINKGIDGRVVDRLLAFGLNINSINAKGETALHRICNDEDFSKESEGRVLASINLLLKRGANVSIQNEWGNTPLMDAIIHDYPLKCMRRLIPRHERRWDPINSSGKSPLVLAFEYYSHRDADRLVKLLVSVGGNVNHVLKNKGNLLDLVSNDESAVNAMKLKCLLDMGLRFDVTSFRPLLDYNTRLLNTFLNHYSSLSDQDVEIIRGPTSLDHRMRHVLKLNLVIPSARDARVAAGKPDQPDLLLLIMDVCDKSLFKESLPNVLLLIHNQRKFCEQWFSGSESTPFSFMKRLINEFQVDPNYREPSSGETVLFQLIGYTIYRERVRNVQNCCEYLLSIESVEANHRWDHQLLVDGKRIKYGAATLLTVALNRAMYRVVTKLIPKTVDIDECDVTQITIRSGFSSPLKLLFLFGYNFTSNRCDILGDKATKCSDEWNHFLEWMRDNKLSLQISAALVVRKHFPGEAVGLTEKRQLPKQVKSILLQDYTEMLTEACIECGV